MVSLVNSLIAAGVNKEMVKSGDALQVEMTMALQKVTRDIKAIAADKYDVSAQGKLVN